MTFDDNKNSYGAVDLEGGQTSSHIKDAAGVGTSWVFAETTHRKKYCKQMKNNVLVSTACPCACAGY